MRGLARWNAVLEEHAITARLSLPHIAFNRRMGNFADYNVTPEGVPLDEKKWAEQNYKWLPSDKDKAFVSSLMQPVSERGKIAGWIAPPPRGIDGLPLDYDYVRLF